MPLIYHEKSKKCNIMVFDHENAIKNTARIKYIDEGEGFNKRPGSKKRTHPIYIFLDANDNYICEVRYGGKTANALQRGLWTNTKKAISYFDSITSGWIDYSHNLTLVTLFSLALNSTENSHKEVNIILQKDINNLKNLDNGNTFR